MHFKAPMILPHPLNVYGRYGNKPSAATSKQYTRGRDVSLRPSSARVSMDKNEGSESNEMKNCARIDSLLKRHNRHRKSIFPDLRSKTSRVRQI